MNDKEKGIIKDNNYEMLSNLESFVGSNIAVAFHSNILNNLYEKEQIETITVTPILLKYWKKDNKTKKMKVNNAIGFDLYCETKNNKDTPYTFTFMFDSKLNIKKTKNVKEAIDVDVNVLKQKHRTISNILEKSSNNKYFATYKGFLIGNDNKELEKFINLAKINSSIVFNNDGFGVNLETKTLKDGWKKKISSSKQLDDFRKKLEKERKSIGLER